MRRLGALFLSLGLVGPALAADPPTPADRPPADEPNWFRRWFLGERPRADAPPATSPAQARPTNPATPPAGRPTANPVPAAPSREQVARMLAEEQRIYLDRLQAISKIKRVADERGDDDLMRRAEDLEAQAEELFKQRSARLPKPADDMKDDRAALERGRDGRPATAQRPPADRRRSSMGGDR